MLPVVLEEENEEQ